MWCVVGGVTSPLGAVIGATLLSILPEAIRFLADYREISNGIILLGVILFAPGGLASLWRRGAVRVRVQMLRARQRRRALRRRRRAARRVARRRSRPRARPDRPQRRREDDARQRATGLAPLAIGDDRARRQAHRRPARRTGIARAGIARTYQNIRLFGALDVRANLAAGAYARPARLGDGRLRTRCSSAPGSRTPICARRPSSLPYGDQRRLEIARALAAAPTVLMLDEPAAGMNPSETTRLVETIRAIARERDRRAADRARHDAGARGVRRGRRAELRRDDRARHAGRGRARSGRRRSLPRQRRGGARVSAAARRSTRCAPATATSRCCTTSRSRSTKATLCAIVGANGAGKTTLLMALAGVMPTAAAHVRFDGDDVTRLPSHARVKRGLVLVPEGRRMLPGMSVEENLQVAASVRGARRLQAHRRASSTASRSCARAATSRPARCRAASSRCSRSRARSRSGRKALLLDEPSMGLAPKLVDEIFAIVADERARGTSILLVEQNARRALALADRAYVMERGRIVLERNRRRAGDPPRRRRGVPRRLSPSPENRSRERPISVSRGG